MRVVLIFLLFFAVIDTSSAEKVELRVKALKIDRESHLEDCGPDCLPWNSWYVYTVKVKEVLRGNFDKKKIRIAVFQHTARKVSSMKNWRIVIDEFINPKTIEVLGTTYYVVNQISDDEKDT